tara:strand:+ start:247 stop:516 length:270 start_codon:yes stop_codon:yes gene_type:complete
MKTNKTLIGILSGLAAGALIGILFAPDKGSTTRKKIKRKSSKYTAKAKDKFDDALENLSKKYDDLNAEGKSLFTAGKKELKNGIDHVNS